MVLQDFSARKCRASDHKLRDGKLQGIHATHCVSEESVQESFVAVFFAVFDMVEEEVHQVVGAFPVWSKECRYREVFAVEVPLMMWLLQKRQDQSVPGVDLNPR